MLGEIDGYCPNSSGFWFSRSHGSGLGYFVFYVWQTITKTIDPAVQEMKSTIIRLTDQLRLLDQDMIRLQQKVNTVLELKEEHKLKEPDEKLERVQKKTD